MDRWYIPSPGQLDSNARATALACSLYGPTSPWITKAVTVLLPAVVLATGQQVYQAISDAPPTTKSAIDAAAVPWQAVEDAATLATNNRAAIITAVSQALVRLRQIQTQAQTFQAQGVYGTANLANLNDLLGKSQLIAGAVNDMAADLVGLVRLLSNQFDGTT